MIGSEGIIHFDDSSENKALYFQKTKFNNKNELLLKSESAEEIQFDKISPLENELKYFINIINGSSNNIANIDNALDVIRVLDMASNAMK